MKSISNWLYIFFLVITFFGLSSTWAQGTNQSQTNLGDVVVRFCNNVQDRSQAKEATKSLYLEAKTGISEDICIYINNAGPTDITAKLNFVDGTVTADKSQKKACQPEGVKSNFGQYVTLNEDTYTVAAGKTLETHAQISFPSGFAGMSYGCITLQLEGQNISGNEDSMFQVLSRRANFIDVLVDGDIDLDLQIIDQPNFPLGNIGNNSSFIVYKSPDSGAYMATLSVENKGNIAQDISVTPFVSTRFQEQVKGSYSAEKVIINDEIQITDVFTWQNIDSEGTAMTKKVLPGQQVAFDFELSNTIPWRQGSIGVEALIETSPSFDFESKNITDDMKKKKSQTLGANFMIIPRRIILAILFLILLLRLSTRKKNTSSTTKKVASVKKSSSGTSSKKTKRTTKVSKIKDKLTNIDGIGPKIEAILYKSGIKTYTDLKNTSIKVLKDILSKNNLKQHDPSTWKKQATKLQKSKKK